MFTVKTDRTHRKVRYWAQSESARIRYGPFKDKEAAQYWTDRANMVSKPGVRGCCPGPAGGD